MGEGRVAGLLVGPGHGWDGVLGARVCGDRCAGDGHLLVPKEEGEGEGLC